MKHDFAYLFLFFRDFSSAFPLRCYALGYKIDHKATMYPVSLFLNDKQLHTFTTSELQNNFWSPFTDIVFFFIYLFNKTYFS